MKRCRACSWTPKTEPKVFCPACGAYWEKAKPPSKTRREPSIDKGKPKKTTAKDTPKPIIVDDLEDTKAPKKKPVAKKKTTVKKAKGS